MASSREWAASRARMSSTAVSDVPSGTWVVMVTRYSIGASSPHACVALARRMEPAVPSSAVSCSRWLPHRRTPARLRHAGAVS